MKFPGSWAPLYVPVHPLLRERLSFLILNGKCIFDTNVKKNNNKDKEGEQWIVKKMYVRVVEFKTTFQNKTFCV